MRYLLLILFLTVSFICPALADCTSPAGAESQTRYDFTAHKMYYCDGTSWVEVGGAGGGGEGSSSGGGQVFTSSGTFTVPAGVTRVKVTLIGGGGGGSRLIGWGTKGAGGGATVVKWLSVTPGSNMAVTVGAGGVAGSASVPDGGNGTASQFAGLTAAPGLNGGTGGAGGVASGGDLNINGGAGNEALGGAAAPPYSDAIWGRGGDGQKAGQSGIVIIEW